MAAYGGTGTVSGSDYGSLSKNDAFRFQQKMLPIAMKLLTFSRFAQRDVKPLKEGLELRFRRYEKIPYTGRDVPIAEGVTPDFDTISHRTYLTTLQRFGTFVNVTDLMLAVSRPNSEPNYGQIGNLCRGVEGLFGLQGVPCRNKRSSCSRFRRNRCPNSCEFDDC